MKIRVADYIARFLVEHDITQLFSVVGGGAMHLNNAFALESRLNKIYDHHEQACAIAAESYSRINNKMAAVCVTSGPGGTNAITGVLCAWQDSLPVMIISGQVRSDITVDSTGLDLRQFGEQEYYIVRSVKPMTKYAVMVTDAKDIRYHLEKAYKLALTGRRGPVWIDVPLDIQGQTIDTDELRTYHEEDDQADLKIDELETELKKAKKPVLIAGSGVRTSGALSDLRKIAEKLNIPVICPTSTVDYFSPDDDLYFGMFGTFGSRAGNFIVQNADLLVVFGARLSFKQIGFNFEAFSPDSRKIVIDADKEELKKPTVHIDLAINADLADVVLALRDAEITLDNMDVKWGDYCRYLKNKFHDWDKVETENISAYNFSYRFMEKAPEDAVVVLGNNTAAVSMLQCGIAKSGQRMYGNVNCGTMGYDLPASIGAAIAKNGEVYCATGEGSMMMNLQELQTMAYNNLPIKIILFDNNKYQAIVGTHQRFFGGVLAGCTNDSGIGFPSFEKVADTFGFAYKAIDKDKDIDEGIDWILGYKGRAILDLVQKELDPIIPRLSSKQVEGGKLVSPTIDDLAPFLTKDEYESCLFKNFK
ncbi:MAG: thiamine pyrophosphate-binding protein [Lachnospiraceae bacterium]|nr:thiamine pyrophosphate-binding protein [Lachnospiraceae bacterium]